MRAKEFLNDYFIDDLNVFGRHEEHYSLDNLMEEYAKVIEKKDFKELFGLIESIHHLFESDKPITKDSHIGMSIELAYKTFKD